jgi:hypothetical protein
VKPLIYAGLTGGVNVAVPGQFISDTEMQRCINFEYSINGNKLVPRGGLSTAITSFPSSIKGLYYDFEMNAIFVFLANNDMYSTNLNTNSYIGVLAGVEKPVCTKFGGKVLISSGHKLQSYAYDAVLNTIDSPHCDIVWERFGRVGIAKAGDDYLHYSGTGDETMWTADDDDDSASKMLEVGYKDGGDLVSVLPLATDLIVLKSNGKVYQVTNEFPDWAVYEVGRNTDITYRFSALNLGSDVLFVGRRGLMSIAAIREYGNVDINRSVGEKFNELITPDLYHPTLWHLRRKRQLLIRPNDGNTIIAFHYTQGAATVLQFPAMITDIIETPTATIVASGSSLYYWDETNATDYGDTDINATITFKKAINDNYSLIRRINSVVEADTAGSYSLTINALPFTHTWTATESTQQTAAHTNYRTRIIEPVLVTTSAFCFEQLILEVANV